MDEEDDWLYTLIGTAPPKPTVEKEIEERIINKKIPKAEDLGEYPIQFWPLLPCWYSFRYQGACFSYLLLRGWKWFYFQMQNIACACQSFSDYFLLFTGLTICYDNRLMNTSTLKLILNFHLIDVSAFFIFLNDVQIHGGPWDG